MEIKIPVDQDPEKQLMNNILSPSGRFRFKFKKLKALNPSAFGCKIAFLNMNEELIYHNNKTFAHELHNKLELEQGRLNLLSNKRVDLLKSNKLEIVKWSKQGNVAYFLEYYTRNQEHRFDSIILHLLDKYCYRINEIENKFQLINQLNLENKFFDERIVINYFKDMGVPQCNVITDPIKTNFLDKFIKNDPWLS